MTEQRNLFLSLAAALIACGVIMVHSASITSWPTEFEQIYLTKHVTYLAIAIAIGTCCAVSPPQFWFRAAPLLFAVSVVLLVAVLIPGVGTAVNGAQRWLRFGVISFQPSELAKLALPLLLCRILAGRRQKRDWDWIERLPVFVPFLFVVPLVMIEPDLGTSIYLVVIGAIALFLCGWPIRYFLGVLLFVIPVSTTLLVLKPYQAQRITGFIAAWHDLNQAPYQLKQSLVTLGTGGVWGVGLGKGWQKLSFLPEANTDFVFAVVGEELGLIGTLGLVCLWCGLFGAGFQLLKPLNRVSFEYTAGLTLLTQLVLQAALNSAVVTAIVPPKGIPHPLVSYGGSSLLVSTVILGLVVSLTKQHATSNEQQLQFRANAAR